MSETPLLAPGPPPDSKPPSDERADRIPRAAAAALTNGGAVFLGALWAGPEGPVAGAAAGAAAGGAAQIYVERWMLALSRLCERIAEKHGPDALRDLLASQPEKAALLIDASEATVRSSYEAKVEAIARAIANGMLYEDDVRFDVEAHVVRTIIALNRSEVAILIAIGDEYVPETELEHRLAKYAFVLPAKLNELRRLGLTEGMHEDPEAPGLWQFSGHKLTGLGRDIRQRFQSAADALKEP